MANINSQFRSGGILRPWDIDIRTGRPRPGILIQELGIEVQAGPQSVAIGKHIIVAEKSVAIGEQIQPGPGYGAGKSVLLGFNLTHAGGVTVQLGSDINAGGGNSVYLGSFITAPSKTNNILIGTAIDSVYDNCIMMGTSISASRNGEIVLGSASQSTMRMGFLLPQRADQTAAADLPIGSFFRVPATGVVCQKTS